MSYLDKTFCASPNCKNACGRKMTDKQKEESKKYHYVWYAYFCGEPEEKIKLHTA